MTRRLLASAALTVVIALSGCSTTSSAIANYRTRYTQRPLTEMPALPTVRLDSLKTLYPNLPLAYLTDERTIEHQFDFPQVWDFVQDVRRQYVVLDPDDDMATTFSVRLGRRDVLEGAHLRVVAPDGQQSVFALADLIREQDGEAVTYKFAYPNVAAGAVVEESYRLRQSLDRQYQPPLYHDIPLQRSVPVDRMTVRYVYPSSWSLGVKQIGPQMMPEFEIDRTTHAHYTILTARRTRVAPFADEPFSPFFKEVAPYLEFGVTAIFAGDVLPIYQSDKTWEEFATDFGRYVFKRRGGGTGAVAQQARSITDAAAPDSVRLASIVSWVQSNITPVDEGGGTDLPTTLQMRRANELLITGLTQALLEESGIDAEFILIHPASEGYFDPTFIDVHQFTAPAVLVRLEGTDRVVFPYIEGLPVTYLPELYQGATAMKVSAEGMGGFVRLPAGDLSQSTSDERVDVTLDDEGTVRVEETATLRGAAAYGIRAVFKDLTPEERTEKAQEFVTFDDGSFRDFSYTLEGESPSAEVVTLTVRYAVDDLVTITPEEVLFQTGGLLSPASLTETQATPERRRNPIRIYHNSVLNKTITVRYPTAWTLTTPLADAREESRFGLATGRFRTEPGVVTATQRTTLRAGGAAASEAPALDRLTGPASRLNVPTLVFTVAP